MEKMRMSPDRDDAIVSRFRGKVKEQSVTEIQRRFRKIYLGRSPKKPNALKTFKDQFRSGGKTSSSRKDPIALKPLKDANFRFGDKRPLVQATKHETPTPKFTWAEFKKKFLASDTEDEAGDTDDEGVVIASVDKRDMDEAIERKEEPDELFFRSSEALRREALGYATAAISYMRTKGHNLELVKPCLFNSGFMTIGTRTHFNFKAKRADDPSAPMETYFGQLRVCAANAMVVECCVSLGASDSLPYERDNRGCEYCYRGVHHPEGGCEGIIWGRMTWSREKNQYVTT